MNALFFKIITANIKPLKISNKKIFLKEVILIIKLILSINKIHNKVIKNLIFLILMNKDSFKKDRKKMCLIFLEIMNVTK